MMSGSRDKQIQRNGWFIARFAGAVLAMLLVACAGDVPIKAQSNAGVAHVVAMPDWQVAAGRRMDFDVATVRPGRPDGSPGVNFTLGPGEAYANTGGRLIASNISLLDYIRFAYKLTDGQVEVLQASAPKWLMIDAFDIQAKSALHNPTKDQMRLMMQSLLADRFNLSVHAEMRELPVLALVQVTRGRLGPQLRQHRLEDGGCSNIAAPTDESSQAKAAPEVPMVCGALVSVGVPTAPSHVRIGGRNVPLALLASHLGEMGRYDRPVLDETGLSGTFDLILEWGPDPGSESQSNQDDRQTYLQEALEDQLGLRLERRRAPVRILLVDHVDEHPAEN